MGDSPYFIQRFVDSGNLLGQGCEAFSEEEHKALLNTVKPYLPNASLRGVWTQKAEENGRNDPNIAENDQKQTKKQGEQEKELELF